MVVIATVMVMATAAHPPDGAAGDVGTCRPVSDRFRLPIRVDMPAAISTPVAVRPIGVLVAWAVMVNFRPYFHRRGGNPARHQRGRQSPLELFRCELILPYISTQHVQLLGCAPPQCGRLHGS
jgi:hypothetical protein